VSPPFHDAAAIARALPPREAVAALDDLVSRMSGGSLSTLFLGYLDVTTGALVWCSAGHPPPLLSGATPRTLAFAGSLPVGLFADASYQTARFTLPPGRCVVLYTDGVVEARNPDGQEFGTEGLEAAVPAVAASAAAVAEVVLKQVLSHTGGHLDDDAAVLVLRRQPG
jgi:serine phosphatase RsbU (regulator of sigma subunit)